MALEMVIGQTGLASDIFCNGKKAVMAFIKNPKLYHIILLDLNMPIMDGFTAARHIRKRNKKIKILALSAGYLGLFTFNFLRL